MSDSSNFFSDIPPEDDAEDQPHLRPIASYRKELMHMRRLMLWERSQRVFSQANVDLLERTISKMLRDFDWMLTHAQEHTPPSELAEVIQHVRKVRKALLVIADLYDLKRSTRNFEAIYDRFDLCTDHLQTAIELLEQ